MGEVALMAIELPAAPKTYTTKYSNFKGVDFTNDSTNVWYRRSPTGTNMLPDEAGRPMKRHGWIEVVSEEDFLQLYEDTTGNEFDKTFQINRCYYFELAGLDHIVAFTNAGLFCYRQQEEGEDELLLWSVDADCVSSYDRTFFFEGNGTSAFYIYGEYKVWRYDCIDEEFTFKQLSATDLYIPIIRFAISPDGNTGELLEPVNLLGSLVKERFQNNIVYSTDVKSGADFIFTVDIATFVSAVSTAGETTFDYTTDWEDSNHTTVDLADYGITVVGTPVADDWLKVTTSFETVLGLEVDVTKYTQMTVCSRDANGDYTNPITVVASTATPSTGQCKPVSAGGVSKIIYHDAFPQLVSGEDEIEVTYPRDKVVHSASMSFTDTQQMSIGG